MARHSRTNSCIYVSRRHKTAAVRLAALGDVAVPRGGRRGVGARHGGRGGDGEHVHLDGTERPVEEVEVGLEVRFLVALGDHGDALLDLPAQRDLRAALAVLGADGGHQLAADELVRAAGPAQRREALVDDAHQAIVRDAVRGIIVGRSHAHVVLRLVESHRNRCHRQDVVEVPRAVVAHAERARAALLGEVLHRQPLLFPERGAANALPARREVHQH
mmetsp:Transcript_4950/g.19742  ORF Transcript_4950/g.19742 Transcript_4950/m.19742 type:complete len:218 (-) Transcript_4950:385-1038(-)